MTHTPSRPARPRHEIHQRRARAPSRPDQYWRSGLARRPARASVLVVVAVSAVDEMVTDTMSGMENGTAR